MLRCERCGGRATATLGHLHCLNVHLCVSCTREVVEKREAQQPSRRVKRDNDSFGDFDYPKVPSLSQAA